MAKLYYIHDPMCSWCYAFDTVLAQIKLNLPKSIELVKLVGGLAADSMEPMSDSTALMVQENWRKIEQTVPNVQFNFDFWKNNQAIRSTYPSCRAVLAAKKQSDYFEDKMIAQIQWAYYKNAENPALSETLISCASQIGLDHLLFKTDYQSQFINDLLFQQIDLVRRMRVSSYPSLCLEQNNKIVGIKVDYLSADKILKHIFNLYEECSV